MAPGLGYYLIKFKFEGFWYFWSDELEGYFNYTTQKLFRRAPVGSVWNDECWISQWKMNDDMEG